MAGITTSYSDPSAITWREDVNSPVTGSATNSLTVTLAGSYDIVRATTKASNPGSLFIPEMRVNGDADGNYSWRDVAGGTTNGASSFELDRDDDPDPHVQTVILNGRWGTDSKCRIGQPAPMRLSGTDVSVGENAAVSSPLSSITLLDAAANNPDMTIRVEGADL